MRSLFILVILGFAVGTRVNFNNRCSYRVEVIRTENGRAPVQQAVLNPGQTSGGDFKSNGMNFKNGWNGKTLDEFSFNAFSGLDFYDLSVIVGYDTPMQISSNKGGCTVTCRNSRCPDAYLFPTDDTKTRSVSTGGTFTVTFCP
ncbi:hypothetical protein PRIPAC_88172 [Pristionchus pacificus]|uniref:Uncharacterized protein n=1 Tax=Pristionchus pacificus TaxID=54126 RepID=A0A2A6B8K9_PRIPA|nr:hypothetical protein PRIPAC_88172 [Pristionchus pacificus]|eukprot:PDM62208.1 hypothetical protein PRIPAC_51650 [Pristionchus pacificus]